jgi:hypothetical protein
MNIQSRLQIARMHVEKDASTMLIPFEPNRSQVLKHVRPLHRHRNLLQANKHAENFIGHQSPDTDDPFGRVLRQLRNQKGIEACVVASNACISVWQLYELETGKDTFFYTAGLRNKAAHRVAEFLGGNWSEILKGSFKVETAPTHTAHVHVLKTPLTEARTSSAFAAHQPLQSPLGGAQTTQDNMPVSTALFLRVRDDQAPNV